MHTAVCTLVLLHACLLLCPAVATAAAIPVELRQAGQGWQLLRGCEPYFIRGAGGSASLEQLAAAESGCEAHIEPIVESADGGTLFRTRGENAFLFAQLFLALEAGET